MIDEKRFPNLHLPSPPFENADYELRITYTISTDKRIMSFVDTLWGIEVTGGIDQFEPLTVIGVKRSGLARRAGIRVNDKITRINDTFADQLTLKEAQLLIRQSGKRLRIYVEGDTDVESDDEFTVDLWFKPPRKKIQVENKWKLEFPWNDKKRKIYRESNCFMVPSKAEERLRTKPPSSDENVIDINEMNEVGKDLSADSNNNNNAPTLLNSEVIR